MLLYVSLAVATGFADLRMRPHTLNVVKDISGVVADTEYAPGKYRVLAPFTIDGLATLSGASLEATWYATRLLFIFLAYLAIHAYLRTWFQPVASLTGVAVTAATLPLTITNSWPHPDAMPELALFALGALAIARRLDVLFAVVLALAAFNRETSVFLVVLFFVAYPLTRARLVRTALFGLEWLRSTAGSGWCAASSTTTTGWPAGTSPTSDCCRRTTTRTIASTRTSRCSCSVRCSRSRCGAEPRRRRSPGAHCW